MTRKFFRLWTFFSVLIISTSCAPGGDELTQQVAIAVAETERSYTEIPSNTPYPTYTLQATYTPYPTFTLGPTQPPRIITFTHTPTVPGESDMEEGKTIASPIPAEVTDTPPVETETSLFVSGIDQEFFCGADMSVKVYEYPDTKMRVSSDRATGIYLRIKFEINNLSDRTWSSVSNDSFSIKGLVNGEEITYSINPYASSSSANNNGMQVYSYDDIQPGLPYHTYLVFDVNPAGKNWVLHFEPDFSNWDHLATGCVIEIPLLEKLPGQ